MPKKTSAALLGRGTLQEAWVHVGIAHFPLLVPLVNDLFNLVKFLHEVMPHGRELLAQVRLHALEEMCVVRLEQWLVRGGEDVDNARVCQA